jgi:hypothetical protein
MSACQQSSRIAVFACFLCSFSILKNAESAYRTSLACGFAFYLTAIAGLVSSVPILLMFPVCAAGQRWQKRQHPETCAGQAARRGKQVRRM